MHSLKTKLVVSISLFVLVLFGLTTFLSLGEKQKELTQDIFVNARSYASLTAEDIVESYNLYIPQKSFVYFNRDVQDVFGKFQDLQSIQIVSFNGEIVYDSIADEDKQYEGAERKVDAFLLTQIQAINPSVYTLDTDRSVFFKYAEEAGDYLTVDENEQMVRPLIADEKVEYYVQPATEAFSVVYYISYENLQARIMQTMIRGLLIGIFGIGIGILIAYLLAVKITKPLKQLTLGAGIIAKGDFKHRVEVTTKDELSQLAGAFNSMAKELEISTKALVYKERVAKELEIAAEIQKDLLPKEIPKVVGMDIAAGVLPAEEIGGDCYDFLKIDDDNLLMYMGDVTGHGVPSGIVVAITNALIYNYKDNPNMMQILTEVNRILKEKTAANMFITLVMLHWNSKENILKYVSAGHEQMIHYHAKENKVTLVPSGGLALGMIPDISKVLKEELVHMEEGDALVAYSDGIPEAWKSEKDMYGMAALKRSVNEYSDLPSALAIRNAILADVKEWAGTWKQMDDITALVLKRLPGGGIDASGSGAASAKDALQKTVEKAEEVAKPEKKVEKAKPSKENEESKE